jgi:hypothetical protein
MSGRWRELDLEGGGLQSANARLVRLLRKRFVAYALVVLFPLGVHRFYLHDRRGGLAYAGATLAAAAAAGAGYWLIAAGIVCAQALVALADALRIEARLAAVNKRLRMQVYLSQGAGAPPGFRGHHTDEAFEDYLRVKEAEVPGHAPAGQTPPAPGARAPSFAEQERLLRELARRKNDPAGR